MNALYAKISSLLRDKGYTATLLEGGFRAAAQILFEDGAARLAQKVAAAAVQEMKLKGKNHER